MTRPNSPSRLRLPLPDWLATHRRTSGLIAVLASALLFVLAFPTTELGPLALIALVPVLVAMRSRTRWQRFRLGWLLGIAVELTLFRWIPFTMTEMTSIAGPLTWLMALAYALWHGLRLGVFLALAEPLRRALATRPRLAPWAGVAVALIYLVVEWLWPVIFPWMLGHALWEAPGAGELLALQGVPLLTFVVALVNAGLADAWWSKYRGQAPGSVAKPLLVPLAVLVLLLVLAFIFAPRASDETLRVAIVQPNFTLAEKKKATLALRKTLLDRIDAQIRALPRDTFDLVIASEGAFPMWWVLDADSHPGASSAMIDATRRIARAVAEGPHADAIIGGLRQDENKHTRNSAVHIGRDGGILGHYDKQTLVPFSEYMPFVGLIPSLGEIRGVGNVLEGDTPCAFDVMPTQGKRSGPVHVACGICYESMFADRTRADAGQAELLVNLTIDTWFGNSTAPRMHLMTQASRAAELGVPLLRSALTGISAQVDIHGRVVASLPVDVPGVLDATVVLSHGTTVFRELGQLFAPLGALLVLSGLVDAFRRRKLLRDPPA